MSSPFDLELIMPANPRLDPSNSPYHIDMLPTEILYMVFDIFSRLSSSGRGQVQPIVLLSHISQHWRHVALGAPALWNKLDIYSYKRPDVLRTFLSRSDQRSLYIRIDWPETIFYSGDEIPDFTDTCNALSGELHRIKRLSITARNFTLRRLTEKVLVDVQLSHLQYLELVSVHDYALMILGPFRFNPQVFDTLHVEHTMIEVRDGRCLSGLRRAVFTRAPLSYLDERQIPSAAFPVTPINWYTDLPTPSLSRLEDLRIHAPLLHPVPGRTVPVLTGPNGQVFPPLPFAPSFRARMLRSVTLSSLSDSSLPYQAEVTPEVLKRLFFILTIAELQEMHLIDFRDQAIEGLFQALGTLHCRFSYLEKLKITRSPIEDMVQYSETMGMANFEALCCNAFPLVSEVYLNNLDPEPLVDMLGQITMFPSLQKVEYGGSILNVRIPSRI
ncbi:hypothetical protein APHAL10511_007429 [Amanita phalloides]|nr:hypothetical protein APHAL10511_007429 [Amanita phalloides]